MLARSTFFRLFVFVFAFCAAAQATFVSRCGEAVAELQANPHRDGLYQYEATQKLFLGDAKPMDDWHSQTGFRTEHDADGNLTKATLRVLTDNPFSTVEVIGDFNDWGKGERVFLNTDPDDRGYHKGTVPNIKHGQEYRLIVDGKQLLDPAATTYTSLEWAQKRKPHEPSYINSIFWDHARKSEYKMETANGVDLRGRAHWIVEADLWGLAAKFKRRDGQVGPKDRLNLYKFIAETPEFAEEIAKRGNILELMPPTTYVDGDNWAFHYLNYGVHGPDSRWGSPEDFKKAVDALQKKGVAVVLDIVPGHFPDKGNAGIRELSPIGMHNFMNHWGNQLFGQQRSEWDTLRPDFKNPMVQQFFIDGTVRLFKEYGISGVRIDNIDGIRRLPGGVEFLEKLNKEIRKYRPAAYINGECFGDHAPMVKRLDQGGQGMDSTNDGDLYGNFIRPFARGFTQDMDMWRLDGIIRNPWGWNIAPRMTYSGNHDEYAQGSDGMSGAYPATKLEGGGDYYIHNKIKIFTALARLSSPFSLNMLQAEFGQRGSLANNPELDWNLLGNEKNRQTDDFMKAMYGAVKDRPAFGFQNHHPHQVNHVDNDNKVISMLKVDFKTGKKYYVILNLGDRAIDNYRFGADAQGDFKVILDSDRSEFGGSGKFKEKLPGDTIGTDGQGEHSKPHSFKLPHLAPYQTLILEQQ